jgi:hypothetical protein
MNDKIDRRKYRTPFWIKVCIFISGVAIAMIIANILLRM